MPDFYDLGTVAVTAGSPIVRLNTPTGTWLPGSVDAGDDIMIDDGVSGPAYWIKTNDGVVSGKYQLTLASNYRGATHAARAYVVRRGSPDRATSRGYNTAAAELIDKVSTLVSGALAPIGEATAAPGNMFVWSGPSTGSMWPVSASALSLLDDADASAMRDTLGLTPVLAGLTGGVEDAAATAEAVQAYVGARTQSGCFVYCGVDTPTNIFPSGVITPVPFDTVAFDYDNWWDISYPSTFFVPNRAGIIGVYYSAGFFLSSAGAASSEIRVTKQQAGGGPPFTASYPGIKSHVRQDAGREFFLGGFMPMSPGERLQLEIYQVSGEARGCRALSTSLYLQAIFAP